MVVFVLAGIIAAVMFMKKSSGSEDKVQDYEDAQQAVDAAAFDFDYTDRLVGVPATGYKSNTGMIEITYGDAGFVRKALESEENAEERSDLTEEDTQNINGYDVTLRGKDGKIYLATWNYNGFDYMVSINDGQEGVSVEDMSDYIYSIR